MTTATHTPPPAPAPAPVTDVIEEAAWLIAQGKSTDNDCTDPTEYAALLVAEVLRQLPGDTRQSLAEDFSDLADDNNECHESALRWCETLFGGMDGISTVGHLNELCDESLALWVIAILDTGRVRRVVFETRRKRFAEAQAQ